MREYSTPLTTDIPATGNLTDDVVANAARHADGVVFSRRSGDDGWEDVTAPEFLAEVSAVAKGLVAAGRRGRRPGRPDLQDPLRVDAGRLRDLVRRRGDRADLRDLVGRADRLDPRATPARRAVVAERPDAPRARSPRSAASLDELNHVWSLDDNAIDVADPARRRHLRRRARGPAYDGDAARPRDADLHLRHHRPPQGLHAHPRQLHVRARRRRRRARASSSSEDDASTLLFLPLAHVFARIIQVGCVKSRVRLGHTADIKHLLPDLARVPADVPPRRAAGLREGLQHRLAAGDRRRPRQHLRPRRRDRDRLLARPGARQGAGRRCAPSTRVFDRLVYAQAPRRARRQRAATPSPAAPRWASGSATSTAGIGADVLEGYGLTETTAALTVNLPDAIKVGTVGQPLPGTAVRVADDGELLFRGGQVFAGYWHNEEATAEALERDGWFHTGDLGEVDDEGFVRITGRKKEILVTAGGKNVAPAVLEDRVRAHPLVEPVPGRRRRPAVHRRAGHARPRSRSRCGPSSTARPATVADLVDDPDLLAEVQAAVDEANEAVSQAESIRKFAVLPDDWTEEGGQLTPSLKLKRNVVVREQRDEIDALYVLTRRPGQPVASNSLRNRFRFRIPCTWSAPVDADPVTAVPLDGCASPGTVERTVPDHDARVGVRRSREVSGMERRRCCSS